MGNEQTVPAGSQNSMGPRSQPAGPSSTHGKVPTEHEILIVIRGLRRTGKSTLVKRMSGEVFNETYIATSMLAATEIPWTSPKGESVNVTCWDVVERALMPVDATERMDAADATTIDTLKRADGLVVMIDSRFKDTVVLAEKIISSVQGDLPILVFNNFMDQEDSSPVLPELLQKHMGRMFFYVPGSLKTNQGLVEVSNWLTAPLLMSKKKMHYNIYRALESDLLTANAEFAATASNFIDLESAKKNMPKFVPAPAPVTHKIPSQELQEPPTGTSSEAETVQEETLFVSPVRQQQRQRTEQAHERPQRKSYEKPYKRRQQRTTSKPKVTTSAPEPEPAQEPPQSEDPFGGSDEEEAPKRVVRRRSRGSSRVKVSPKCEQQSVKEEPAPKEEKPEPAPAPEPVIAHVVTKEVEKEEEIEGEGAFWSDEAAEPTPVIETPMKTAEPEVNADTLEPEAKNDEPLEDEGAFWSDEGAEPESKPVQTKTAEPENDGDFWSDEGAKPEQESKPVQPKNAEPEDDGGFWSDDADEPDEPEPVIDDDDDDEVLRPNPLVQMQVKSVNLQAAIKTQVEENEDKRKEVYAPMPEPETGYETMNELSEDEVPAHADDDYGEMEGTDSPTISAPQKKTAKRRQKFQRRK